MNIITEIKKALAYTNPKPETGKISGALATLFTEFDADLIDVKFDPSEKTLAAIKDLRREIADFEEAEFNKQLAAETLVEEEEEEEDTSWQLPEDNDE